VDGKTELSACYKVKWDFIPAESCTTTTIATAYIPAVPQHLLYSLKNCQQQIKVAS